MESVTPQFKIGINIVNDASNGNVCELYFTDAIYNKVNFWTGEDISMLQECIDKVNESKPYKIIQYIDSWGGSAPVGFGIYNYLKQHSAKIETKILNNCASIASVMAMAGNKGKITMPRNGMMVIHQAQSSAQGTAAELREAADVCDKYTDNVLDVYVQNNRKGKTKDELYNCIKDGDYWMTGTEAKEMGFVDDVYNDDKITITNSIAAAKKVYNNIPQHILDMEESEPTGLFDKIKNLFEMKVAEIKAAFTDKLPTDGVVGTGEHALDIKALLGPSIDAMLETIGQQVTADIAEAVTNATTSVTDGVTALETKYKEVLNSLSASVTALADKLTIQAELITAQAAKIEVQNEVVTAQAKTITDLTADVSNIQGKPVPAAGNEGDAARSGTVNRQPTFRNRTVATNVSD